MSRLMQGFHERNAMLIHALHQAHLDSAKWMRNYVADAAKDHVEEETLAAETELSRAVQEKTAADAELWKLETILHLKEGWSKISGENIGQLLAGDSGGSAK